MYDEVIALDLKIERFRVRNMGGIGESRGPSRHPATNNRDLRKAPVNRDESLLNFVDCDCSQEINGPRAQGTGALPQQGGAVCQGLIHLEGR